MTPINEKEAVLDAHLRGHPARVLTVAETAAFLSSTKSWLDQARMGPNGPPFVRIGEGRGSRVGYRLKDLEAWLDTRVRHSI